MNLNQSSTDISKIVRYLKKLKSGSIFTIEDLRNSIKDISYTSIRTIVVNLSNQKVIIRVARGIYCLPRTKNDNSFFPSIVDVIDKITSNKGIKYCPKGEYAEYLIGIRNDIPKTIYCYTSGKVKTINLTNGISIKLIPSKRKLLAENLPKEVIIAENYIRDMGLLNIDPIRKKYIKGYITVHLNSHGNKIIIPPNLSRIFNV